MNQLRGLRHLLLLERYKLLHSIQQAQQTAGTADSRQHTADSRQQTAGNIQKTARTRQQKKGSRQHAAHCKHMSSVTRHQTPDTRTLALATQFSSCSGYILLYIPPLVVI